MFTAFTNGEYPSPWSAQGFNSGLTRLTLSPRQRLDDVVRSISDLPFGGTDCALPMVEALKHRWPVDAFVVYTDNETWAGNIHPAQALRAYRERTGTEPVWTTIETGRDNARSIARGSRKRKPNGRRGTTMTDRTAMDPSFAHRVPEGPVREQRRTPTLVS